MKTFQPPTKIYVTAKEVYRGAHRLVRPTKTFTVYGVTFDEVVRTLTKVLNGETITDDRKSKSKTKGARKHVRVEALMALAEKTKSRRVK